MQPLEVPEDSEKPKLPSKTSIGGRKLPAPPPKMVNGVSSNNSNSNKPRLVPGQSPTKSVNNSSTTEISQNNGQNGQKSQNGFKMAEIYTNNHFDHEGGTSVDDSDEDISDIGSPPKTKLIIGAPDMHLNLGAPVGESNDYDSDSDLLKKSSRNAIFGQAEQVLHKVLDHIDQAQKICNQQQGGALPGTVQPPKSKESYVKAKEQLTNESRQFVTASKLFVKSATESEGQLVECLNHCTVMIDRIGKVTIDVSVHTPTPMQTQSLIGKVRDVADTFLQTVLAAGNTTGRDMNDPAMNVLMKKATNLASVLTILMKSLRVFN